jgi:hypothetical protein
MTFRGGAAVIASTAVAVAVRLKRVWARGGSTGAAAEHRKEKQQERGWARGGTERPTKRSDVRVEGNATDAYAASRAALTHLCHLGREGRSSEGAEKAQKRKHNINHEGWACCQHVPSAVQHVPFPRKEGRNERGRRGRRPLPSFVLMALTYGGGGVGLQISRTV